MLRSQLPVPPSQPHPHPGHASLSVAGWRQTWEQAGAIKTAVFQMITCLPLNCFCHLHRLTKNLEEVKKKEEFLCKVLCSGRGIHEWNIYHHLDLSEKGYCPPADGVAVPERRICHWRRLSWMSGSAHHWRPHARHVNDGYLFTKYRNPQKWQMTYH